MSTLKYYGPALLVSVEWVGIRLAISYSLQKFMQKFEVSRKGEIIFPNQCLYGTSE